MARSFKVGVERGLLADAVEQRLAEHAVEVERERFLGERLSDALGRHALSLGCDLSHVVADAGDVYDLVLVGGHEAGVGKDRLRLRPETAGHLVAGPADDLLVRRRELGHEVFGAFDRPARGSG